MYCGCAAPPPRWLKEKNGVDIDAEVADTIPELGIASLPPELRGQSYTRIAQAAQALGYAWEPQLKFMNPARTKNFDCGAKYMLGCRCGAKWNAAEYVDQAVNSGLILQTRACVDRVLIEEGHANGVSGSLNGNPFIAKASQVILAAGGIGTPRILQASGFREAGIGMTMDVTVMVYGTIKNAGIGNEPPMTWSWENLEDGYMLSTLIDPWMLYPIVNFLKGPQHSLTWPRWNNTLGAMIKLKDEISGGVFSDGKISKPLTMNDKSRLKQAEEVCRKILIEAGARPDTIFVSPLRGTHPSGTVRIDTMLDKNLETEAKGLFAMPASFPRLWLVQLCLPLLV